MQLNPLQREAVESWGRGDICVIAGPGSGKTRVLVERLRWLVVERDIDPSQILAITFTEKAAVEMRRRLREDSGLSDGQREMFESAQISTIDAYCSRLLRERALEAGVDPGFEILAADEADELLAATIERALDEAFGRGGPDLEAFLASYAPAAALSTGDDAASVQMDLAGLIYRIRSYGDEPSIVRPLAPLGELSAALRKLAEVNEAKANELAHAAEEVDSASIRDASKLAATLESLAAVLKPVHKRGPAKDLVVEIKDSLMPACRAAAASAANERARNWLRRLASRTLELYQREKRDSGRLDFDDGLALAAQLLGSDECPTLGFKHILIDEFQDTNPLQVQLVERLLDAHGEQRPQRFVVGDINQSIYGFRHADQNVFRKYRDDVARNGGHVIELLENFRSRQELLAAVHCLLPGGESSGVEPHRLEAARAFPAKNFPSLEVQLACEAGPDSRTQEGLRLARRLLELKADLMIADEGSDGARSLRWGDVAVLVRTHAVGSALARVLREQGIPCLASAERGLFQAPETVELAALLRVLRNPRDEISLAAVLKSRFCGISDADLMRIRLGSENIADVLASDRPTVAGLGDDAASLLARFSELFARYRADRATVSPRFLLGRIVSECGYREFLAQGEDSDAALAHVDQLLDWIARKELQGLETLDAVSAALDRALAAVRPRDAAPQAAEAAEAVQVMTMHAAKGLEFPVVVLAAVHSDSSSRQAGLLFSQEHGIGARWRRPFEGAPVRDAAYEQIQEEIRSREDQEAERLLYVAMTRAKEHLILSASFSGGPRNTGWCKPVFERLEISPKDDPEQVLEQRSRGEFEFRYSKSSGQLDGGGSRASDGWAEPEVLMPLDPSAQADYSAAVTSVALFAQCPRKYFLSRYLGLESDDFGPWLGSDLEDEYRPMRARDDLDPSEFGRQVHEHLAGQLPDASGDVKELAARFANHELGARARRADPAEREGSYVFKVAGFQLRGTIDLLFEEGGELVLVDYKTDKRRAADLEASALGYAPQLQLYAAGLAKADRQVDRAILFYLRHGKPIDVDISAAAIKTANGLVEEFFDAQRSQEFPLREGKQCRHCPHFQKACPAQPGS